MLAGWLAGQGNAYIKQLLAHCILAGIGSPIPATSLHQKGDPTKGRRQSVKCGQAKSRTKDEGLWPQTTALTMQLGRGQNEKLI